MVILGISAYYHDSAAAIFVDGKMVAAAAEERFTRQKHDNGFPVEACRYCMVEAHLSIKDVDDIVFYEKPLVKFERIIRTHINYAPKGLRTFLSSVPIWLKEKLNMRRTIEKEMNNSFGMKPRHISFCRHHTSHAAMTFFTSGMMSSAILVVDAVGENATTSIFRGERNRITLIEEQVFPHSIGLLYSAFTYYLGFIVNSDEYKVMGLAPYGDEKSDEYRHFVDVIENKLITILADGSIKLNEKYFSFMYADRMVCDKTWQELFGIPKRPHDAPIGSAHENLALAIQRVTEKIMLLLARRAKEITGEKNLCLSGGCALNCAVIGKIKESGLFENVYVPFAPGDDGAAIGCALYVQNKVHPENKTNVNLYSGPSCNNEQVEGLLATEPVNYRYYDNYESLCQNVVHELVEGKIVGWYQGAMEFGPRALGNRSILADARVPDMKDKVNAKVKFRESFRPFAPAVLEEYANSVFEIADTAPYMMSTYNVREVGKIHFPAITHIDGTARVQTVSMSSNQRFYALLKSFHEMTGCPMLLNTSFNVMGEPIVCSPEDAVRTYMQSGIDILVINNYLITKQ